MSELDRQMLAVILVIVVLGVFGLLLAWEERERARTSQRPLPFAGGMLESFWSHGTGKEEAPSILSSRNRCCSTPSSATCLSRLSSKN